MINASHKSCRENQKTFLYSIKFSENPAFYDNAENCRAGQATDDNMLCVLGD